jgi:hypothetical protein
MAGDQLGGRRLRAHECVAHVRVGAESSGASVCVRAGAAGAVARRCSYKG